MQSLDTKKIKAIVFDMDGTLVNTTALDIKVFDILFNKKIKNIEKYFGPPLPDIFEKLKKEKKIKGNVRTLVKIWHIIYRSLARNQKLMKEEVKRTLEKLSKKYILGVITSSDSYVTNITLKENKKYFKEIITSDDVKEGKPNPEALLKFMKKYRLKKDEIVYVGDNIKDIEFAKNANIKSIGKVDLLYNEKELKKVGADLVITAITDLIKYF